ERRRPRPLATEPAFFGSAAASHVSAALVFLIVSTTGPHPTGSRHYSVSIGALAGVVLEDGACVAVKVFASWHDPTFLDAARATQRRLVEGGYPAPRPLAERSPLGSGWAWVDSWLEAPAPRAAADAIEPLAAHLADL